MSKNQKHIGVPSHVAKRRLPTPDAPNNSRAPGPRKRKPFVLVVVRKLLGRDWVFRRHYATKESRAQARRVEERSRHRAYSIEEIDE